MWLYWRHDTTGVTLCQFLCGWLAMQRFGEKLRTLRQQHQMTLADLTRALGYAAHSHISAVETGKKQPTVAFVLKVSRLFGISMDHLTKDELDLELGNQPTPKDDQTP
jgi:transcriptional regulator with XRE-family HTH domain